MFKTRFIAFLFLALGAGVGYFDYASEYKLLPSLEKFPLKLGLDLQGGTHLIYSADTSALPENEVGDSMEALRDVIERRVNLFGVAEPVVQVESPSIFAQSESSEERLIVELPGLTDVNKAIEMIGATPVLEFKLGRTDEETQNILSEQGVSQELVVGEDGVVQLPSAMLEDAYFKPTSLTGRYLQKATVEFDPTTRAAYVSLTFDDEGAKLFEDITRENVGKTLAIFLDGNPISTPTIREEIRGGKAQISGDFTPVEAKQLVGRMNSGALPVPIALLSAQTIGASLGEEAYQAVMKAGVYGFLAVILFVIFWYRLPGLLASIALTIYVALMLAIFKLIPVTLTAAGICGFILSIGMAVDANILIFERMKEEILRGRVIRDAVTEGFARAWFSIRDSNLSSIISATILFWFGTSMVEGFALVLGIGVAMSMFTALTITRNILFALDVTSGGKAAKFFFGSGVMNRKS